MESLEIANRSSHQRCFVNEGVLKKFRKFHRKTPVLPDACNFIKKETPTQVFSSEICEIFKNTCFQENLRTTASERRTYILHD